nr:SufD family Fe-S cluster assembly protein [Candidatus Gracilibacteria bacterium]
MYIIKNGFYKNIESDEIVIGDNLIVAIFGNNNILRNVIIGKNSKLEYFGFYTDEGDYDKTFTLNGEKSECTVNSLIYSKNNKLNVRILGESNSNNTKIKVHILSFVGEQGDIKVDGNIKISSGLSKVIGTLKEENIYLGNTGKIAGIPTLLIESNDVEASHSCNIERISDEKLFYLRSRGIGKENALRMIIEAKIKDLYRCIFAYDNKFEKEMLENIIDMIGE